MAVTLQVPYHHYVHGVLAGCRHPGTHIVRDRMPIAIAECAPGDAPVALSGRLLWRWNFGGRHVAAATEIREADGVLLVNPQAGRRPAGSDDLDCDDGVDRRRRGDHGPAWALRPHPFLLSLLRDEIPADRLKLRGAGESDRPARQAEVSRIAARMRLIEGRLYLPPEEPVYAVRHHAGTVYVVPAAHGRVCELSQTFRADRHADALAYAGWLAGTHRGCGVAVAGKIRVRRAGALRHDGFDTAVRNLHSALVLRDPSAGATPGARAMYEALAKGLCLWHDRHRVAEAVCDLSDALEAAPPPSGSSFNAIARILRAFAGRYRMFEGSGLGVDDEALAALS